MTGLGDLYFQALNIRTPTRKFSIASGLAFQLPTATEGDPFQERVWSVLKEIPFGDTTTYGEIADRLGDRTQARAVGQAVGRNPLSIIVACNRVVGRDGKLKGYAGGLERKRSLLELEAPSPVEAGTLF